MRMLLQLSMRNLARHKRRNLILLLAIALAVGGVIGANALIRGLQADVLNSAVSNLTGHVKVHAPGYRDDPGIARGFELDRNYHPDLGDLSLLGWAARVRVPAVVMSERETRGVQLVGIDPAAEAISFIADAQLSGEFLRDADDARIVIGKELARQLETGIGRRLVIIAQGADNLNRERGYRVAGTFDAEGTGLEKLYVFVGLSSVQTLLDSDAVTELSVRLTDERFRELAKRSMVEHFAALEVYDWQDLEPALAQMFNMVDSFVLIWFFLMMGALAFGLVNSLVAAVMERVRELGMLRALGMRKRMVVGQVIVESLILMGIGVVLGLLVGYAIFYWLADGIDLSAWAEGVEMAGMSAKLVPVLIPGDVLIVAVLSMVLGLLASLYPAWRVVRIPLLDAMRS